MTTNEAIEILSQCGWDGLPHGYTGGYREALNMAIEALSAKRTGIDSISRWDVNQLIDDVLENDNLQASPIVWYCLHRLKELSSTERKGKWVVRHPMRYDGKFIGADTDIIPDTRIRHLYCGECDKQMPIFEKFPYCPYCGAPMEGEEE